MKLRIPLKLECPIKIDPPIAGFETDIFLNGSKMKLRIPPVPYKSDDHVFEKAVASLSFSEFEQEQSLLEKAFSDGDSWVRMAVSGDVNAGIIYAVLFEKTFESGKTAESFFRRNLRHIEEWRKTFEQAVKIFQLPLLPTLKIKPKDRQNEIYSLNHIKGAIYENGEIKELFSGNSNQEYDDKGVYKFKIDEFRKSIQVANGEYEIYGFFKYIIEAKRSLGLGNYREAIFDVGTSLELMFETKIKQLAESKRIDFKKLISQTRNTLNAYKELCKCLGATVPDGVQKNIIELRNRVVHDGEIPSFRDCNASVEKATEVAQGLFNNKFKNLS